MELHRFAFHAMASEHELLLWCDDVARGAEAADAAIADVRRIEAKYSRYRDDSVTSRINQSAGGAPVTIDSETASLLRYAELCHAMSGGLFDVTSGVLRRAWDFKRTPPRLPDAETLASALALVGWRDVERSDTSIRLPRAGMEIDFGGIGKEYAADRAATILLDHGIAHALINLGGDVRIAGAQADGSPWRVGIKHPRAPGGVIASVALSEGAIATSGDYERYFEIGGHRFCHLLDPHTGYPVEHLQSVSVIAPLCVVAGSLATIAMLCADKGCAFLDAQRVDYLAVAPDGTLRGPALQRLAATVATDKASAATRT